MLHRASFSPSQFVPGDRVRKCLSDGCPVRISLRLAPYELSAHLLRGLSKITLHMQTFSATLLEIVMKDRTRVQKVSALLDELEARTIAEERPTKGVRMHPQLGGNTVAQKVRTIRAVA